MQRVWITQLRCKVLMSIDVLMVINVSCHEIIWLSINVQRSQIDTRKAFLCLIWTITHPVPLTTLLIKQQTFSFIYNRLKSPWSSAVSLAVGLYCLSLPPPLLHSPPKQALSSTWLEICKYKCYMCRTRETFYKTTNPKATEITCIQLEMKPLDLLMKITFPLCENYATNNKVFYLK